MLASFEAFKIADRKTLPRQKRLQIATAMAMMKKASDFRKVRKRALCYASIIGNVPGIPAEQGSNREDAAALVPVLTGFQKTSEKTNELLEKQNRLIEKGTAVNKKGFNSLKPVSHQSLVEPVSPSTVPDNSLEAGTVVVKEQEKTSKERAKKTKTVAARLEILLHRRPDLDEATAESLAALLKCSKTSIINTPTWKRMVARRITKPGSLTKDDRASDKGAGKEALDEIEFDTD